MQQGVTEVNSLVEILLNRHIQTPLGHAFSFVENEDRVTQLSNTQLLSAASNVAQSLCEHTRAGDRVVLLAPEGVEFIAGFFGCILAARVVVPTYPPLTSRVNRATLRLHELIKDAAPAAFLTTPDLAGRVSALLDQLGSHRAPVVEIDCALHGEDLSPDGAFTASLDSVAMIQYTSGSTI
ncbi:MAG: AMP-binding protein [Arenicellales bacterium]